MSVNKALEWMDQHHRSKPGAPTYSLSRKGNTEDCSSSVYLALEYAGWKGRSNHVYGNTETLFKEPNLKEIYSYEDVQPGDIFIRGGEGTSLGPAGHTGFFYKKDGIVHMNYSNNGISYNDMDSYLTYFLDRKRSYNERYFRPIFNGSTSTNNKKNTNKKNGTLWKNEKWYGVTQAVCNVRDFPSTKTGKIVAQYNPNQKIYYDQVHINDGHYWISYIGQSSGKRRYVAYRESNGKPWINIPQP